MSLDRRGFLEGLGNIAFSAFLGNVAVSSEMIFPQFSPLQETDPAKIEFLSGKIISTADTDSSKNIVCLTYDDSGEIADVRHILDQFADTSATCSFFLVGSFLKYQAVKELVKRMIAEGHDVGYHSMYHDNLTKFTPQKIDADLERWLTLMSKIDPAYRPRFARPPYGSSNPTVIKRLATYGMQTIMWSMTSNGTVSKTINIVTTQVRPGSIVLSHLLRPYDVSQCRAIIDQLNKQGCSIRNLSSGISPTDLWENQGVSGSSVDDAELSQ